MPGGAQLVCSMYASAGPPAAAAGCPVVLKPAPETPLDGYLLADAIHEADLPPGVINVGGEWYFEEFGPESGIASLSMEDSPAPPPTESERKSILDLFKE